MGFFSEIQYEPEWKLQKDASSLQNLLSESINGNKYEKAWGIGFNFLKVLLL